MAHNAGRKPTSPSRLPPRKKPAPLMAFLDPVNHATQRNRVPDAAAAVSLIADFEAVLVRSLATPDKPCAATTQATDTTGLHPGSMADSISRPAICVANPIASIRVMPKRVAEPAAPKICENAGRFVEQEQHRQRERRVTKLIKLQQHERAKSTVGEGKPPISRRNDCIVPRAVHLRRSPTIVARSTMRQA